MKRRGSGKGVEEWCRNQQLVEKTVTPAIEHPGGSMDCICDSEGEATGGRMVDDWASANKGMR